MSDRIETFSVGESVLVIAGTRSGDIRVVTGDPGTVSVVLDGPGADQYRITQVGDVITIDSRKRGLFAGSVDIALTVPVTSTLELACTSGDIDVQGEVDELRASVASGDIRAAGVRTLSRVNSASGDITIGSTEDAEINTASGTIRINRVLRNLRLNAASGDAIVGEIGESLRSKVASSTVKVNSFLGSEVSHKAMSGDLHLGIPPHRLVELDFASLSGDLRNRLPKGDGGASEKLLSISVSAVSGDLVLKAAR